MRCIIFMQSCELIVIKNNFFSVAPSFSTFYLNLSINFTAQNMFQQLMRKPISNAPHHAKPTPPRRAAHRQSEGEQLFPSYRPLELGGAWHASWIDSTPRTRWGWGGEACCLKISVY